MPCGLLKILLLLPQKMPLEQVLVDLTNSCMRPKPMITTHVKCKIFPKLLEFDKT